VPLKKKVCMIGVSAVGKTSLVRRYIESRFSEKYFTTVGVKVDKKTTRVGDDDVILSLWDIYGEDEFQALKPAHLSGASGYLLVADGTRKTTLDQALELHERVQKMLGPTPAVLVVNKADLTSDWEFTAELEESLRARGWAPLRSSAKTGEGVEEAFLALATRMMGQNP
jgi:small GTP-binding protein